MLRFSCCKASWSGLWPPTAIINSCTSTIGPVFVWMLQRKMHTASQILYKSYPQTQHNSVHHHFRHHAKQIPSLYSLFTLRKARSPLRINGQWDQWESMESEFFVEWTDYRSSTTKVKLFGCYIFLSCRTLLVVGISWRINNMAKWALLIMVQDRWNLVKLMAERNLNTMMLDLWI